MGEQKHSQLLQQIIADARGVGTESPCALTAERFVLAVIEKLRQLPPSQRDEEGWQLEAVLSKAELDISLATKNLEAYIGQSQEDPAPDELYMTQCLDAAREKAQQRGQELLTAGLVLDCIFREPSGAVLDRMRRQPGNDARAEAERRQSIADLMAKIRSTAPQLEQLKTPQAAPAAQTPAEPAPQADMAALVEDVKQIRQELSQVIFGQDNAINVFATGYFQASMLSLLDPSRTRPKATFLFAGPPGCGKTFLAEQAARALKRPFMRFDMSEYADKEANIEFCGSDKVYKNGKAGNVTSFVAQNPRCVLLFDEIEKAHLTVIHLFLQMLDAGRLRDNFTDEEVFFTDAIIIMTTNAGKQLYEESEAADLSTVSRKVVLKALQKDVNPVTGAPYFPAAICSRFASGNIVMFNHMTAAGLRTIARKEIQRHAQSLEAETGIQMQIQEDVYTALLLAEGAAADARTVRARAESFFNDELYELLRLLASGKTQKGIESLRTVQVTLDLENADPKVSSLFRDRQASKLLVFAQEEWAALCRKKLPDCTVLEAVTLADARKLLQSEDVDCVLLDMACGAAQQDKDSLNIEDVQSPARDFYHFLRQYRSELPVYLLEKPGMALAEEELISFRRQGVRGAIALRKGRDRFAATVREILENLHQQDSMNRLARENKLLSFETAQSISRNGNHAKIRLFDFQLAVAVDAEDSKNILSSLSRPNVHFEDIIGAGDAKQELGYFVSYLKDPKKYMGTGVKAPRGVLLYGPPGTGKTMLAKAMACESGLTFLAAEGNQFLKKFVGEGPEKVHELFRAARKYAPAVLFIDEIDAIAKERRGSATVGAGTDEVLTAFLTEMDGFSSDPTKPVFVLAATNFDVEPGGERSLDPALLRRFDRSVYIGLPGKEERIRFLRCKQEKNRALAVSEAQIDNIAMRSSTMSLADLDSVVELALRSAIRQGSTQVTDAILEEAFETFHSGDKKRWDPSQLERVARHEAGHAFLSWHSGETPSYLTIVARGNHGGYMQRPDQEGKAIYTKEELLARIRTSLGGRAAEIAYYGPADGISTGASGDLASATAMAMQILCTYGMDADFGLAVVRDTGDARVREAVNGILRQQMAEAIRILEENKPLLDALVAELMVKNHMTGQQIQAILQPQAEK